MGSDAYFAQYRSDLNSIFSDVTATGAKMVFVEDPPFLDPTRDAAVAQIITIATQLAGNYHGVSIVTSARSGLSKSGKYAAYKSCLKTETAAMGCSAGKIAIRTVSGDPNQIGLHLCPGGIPKPLAFRARHIRVASIGSGRCSVRWQSVRRHRSCRSLTSD